MKKILIPLLLVLGLYIQANAQLQKSNFLIGGSANYTHSKNENGSNYYKQNSFSISPKVGYFITDKLVVGIMVVFEQYDIKSETFYPTNKTKSTTKIQSWKAGSFLRYYVPLNEKFAFFGQGSFLYGNREAENIDISSPPGYINRTTSTLAQYSINVAPGFTFFPAEKIGIEFTFGNLGYIHNKTKEDNNVSTKSNGFDIGLNLQSFNLGVSLYL